MGVHLTQKTEQSQTLSPRQQQGLKLLAMNLPALRDELMNEMARNPAIEDVESTLDKTPVSDVSRETEWREEMNRSSSDYPDDDMPAPVYTADEEAMERHQHFLDSQVAEETLEAHLLKQLELSDIAPQDRPLAEMLIGELDDKGYFAGSIPDWVMVSGESEAKVRSLLAQISRLDPLGCGATDLRECLLAQLEKLAQSPYKADVQALIDRHLAHIAANDFASIAKDLGFDYARYAAALRALRTLEPRPGRGYCSTLTSVSYVNPEVHAVKVADRWLARVDARSLPEIHLSPRIVQLSEDPNQTDEVRQYARERIAAARLLIDSIAHREETITNIAQAIFDSQRDFFDKGLKGLHALTMKQIADQVGVNISTVSRTVNDKYASTPRGVIELRRFFVQGVVTAEGQFLSKDSLQARLEALIESEDKAHPFSDDELARRLSQEGIPVARRTVAKYRQQIGLPTASERKLKS